MKLWWVAFWFLSSVFLAACGEATGSSSPDRPADRGAAAILPGKDATPSSFGQSAPYGTLYTPAPTSTTTPIPTPTPPPALSLRITIDPPVVAQGRVAAIRVVVSNRADVAGDLDGRPFTLAPEGKGGTIWWAVLGFGADIPLGRRQLTIKAMDQWGQTSQLESTIEVAETTFKVERVRLPPGQEGLLAPEVMSVEKAFLDSVTTVVKPEKLWEGLFLVPTGGAISSLFGARRAYNDGPPGSPHGGSDISAEAGTPVVAANQGKVVLARPLNVRGNVVLLDHGMGVYSGYYHMSEIMVQEGQKVAKGELIGLVGETGMATGPHLHWDMIVTGVNVSPEEWAERVIPNW